MSKHLFRIVEALTAAIINALTKASAV